MSAKQKANESPGMPPALFATTHWSVVLAAGQGDSPQAAEALERLCRTYWYPLYAYVRQRGYAPEDAQDLTQGFFARILRQKYVGKAQAERGKFRWFLLTSFRHFLANEWDRAKAEKRGGDAQFIPIDQAEAEGRYRLELRHELTAENVYERTWALTVIEGVRARLKQEYVTAGKAQRFEVVDQFLPGEDGEMTQAEAALRLDLSAGGFRAEVHRLRRRYGELLRAEIAHTVADPGEIDPELRHLIEVLSG
jgi:DNA-directed RNA polymerase specialized sigma24 family protein